MLQLPELKKHIVLKLASCLQSWCHDLQIWAKLIVGTTEKGDNLVVGTNEKKDQA